MSTQRPESDSVEDDDLAAIVIRPEDIDDYVKNSPSDSSKSKQPSSPANKKDK